MGAPTFHRFLLMVASDRPYVNVNAGKKSEEIGH